MASEKGHFEVVNVLLQAGLLVNLQDKASATLTLCLNIYYADDCIHFYPFVSRELQTKVVLTLVLIIAVPFSVVDFIEWTDRPPCGSLLWSSGSGECAAAGWSGCESAG